MPLEVRIDLVQIRRAGNEEVRQALLEEQWDFTKSTFLERIFVFNPDKLLSGDLWSMSAIFKNPFAAQY